MATEQKEVIGLLETVLLRNPVLKLFNTVISKVPLVSDLSVHFGSLFLNSISQNWQKLLVFAGATAITATTALYLRKLYLFANIYIKHTLNKAKSSAELLK